jgi:hypothetical protein
VFAKLFGKIGGSRTVFCHHKHPRHRRIQTAHNTEKSLLRPVLLQESKHAVGPLGSIGRGQTGGLDQND